MEKVSFAQPLPKEVGDPSLSGAKNQGILKTDGEKYSFFPFSETASISEAASEFLQEVNQNQSSETLAAFKFTHITEQLIQTEHEIALLLRELNEGGEPSKKTSQNDKMPQEGEAFQKSTSHATKTQETHYQRSDPRTQTPQNKASLPKGNDVVYSSLDALARSFQSNVATKERLEHKENATHGKTQGREENRIPAPLTVPQSEKNEIHQSRYDREREGGGNKQKGQDEEQERQKKNSFSGDKKKKTFSIQAAGPATEKPPSEPLSLFKPQAATPKRRHVQSTAPTGGSAPSSPQQNLGSVENIYIRFMALMARILGQAEYEAHQLYVRIKERTDNIDVLTLLVSKVNSEKGAIDWSKNEEMKQLVEKARAIGVDIPQGKYTWSEEEKRLLKENVQMRKDSMEKMTQLERTDMQRFLQEASQCHQARSNVLKLLKEVIDTIVANIRP